MEPKTKNVMRCEQIDCEDRRVKVEYNLITNFPNYILEKKLCSNCASYYKDEEFEESRLVRLND